MSAHVGASGFKAKATQVSRLRNALSDSGHPSVDRILATSFWSSAAASAAPASVVSLSSTRAVAGPRAPRI